MANITWVTKPKLHLLVHLVRDISQVHGFVWPVVVHNCIVIETKHACRTHKDVDATL